MPHLLVSLNLPVAGADPPESRRPADRSIRRAVDGRHRVETSGLDGAAQGFAETTPSLGRALYAYPSEHYPFWQTVRAQLGVAGWDDTLAFGALGEDLTLAGLLEADVWVGDVLRFPDCRLAVSEPPVPSAAFNLAMGFEQASRAMAAQAWCGFHLAVRVPGSLCAGEAFEVVPGPRQIGVAELFRARR